MKEVEGRHTSPHRYHTSTDNSSSSSSNNNNYSNNMASLVSLVSPVPLSVITVTDITPL